MTLTRQDDRIVWRENIGQNGWDALIDVPLNQSVSSRNISLFDGGLGTKRGGSASITITGVTAPINALIEYVPAQDLTAAELFVFDGSATTKILRCAGGASFTNLTLKDNVASEPYTVGSAVLNGKLYLAYDSTVNRLHVFDPSVSTTEVRRAGLAPFGAAATVANTGAGAYPATLRYYKTRNVIQVSSVVTVRSEGNTSVSFTPSGAGTAARITRPTAVGEAETHWEVYGSTDGITFYGPIATVAIGTTTYDDSSTPSTWASTYSAEPVAGFNTPFPSLKSIGTDGTRLYGLGVWETATGDSLAPKSGRFYFGPVQDSSQTPFAQDDGERINNTTTLKGYIDLARNSGAQDRGVTRKPVNNVIYAFQSNGVYGIYPTDSDTKPYRRYQLDGDVGSLSQQSIVVAQDRTGKGCAFFLDPSRGPYCVGGVDGLKWCGKDLGDFWTVTVNRDASTLTAWGLWFPDRLQVWFVVAAAGSAVPVAGLILDVTKMYVDPAGDLRGGWTIYDGDLMQARCGCMFSNVLTATRSRVRVPYTSGNSKLLRYDETLHRDDTTQFGAYVQSGSIRVDATAAEVLRAYVFADAASGVQIHHTLTRDAGAEVRESDVTLTAAGTETIVVKKVEDVALTNAWTIQVKLGDQTTANNGWHLYQYRAQVLTGADL